ncbi:hypothetical protein C4F40_11990 [Sphingobacterium sp. Ka21]|uniref:Uncharacterized protein n=1 Tax=Sphingobacterium pedocola TaxID=2082722 RepID=A0ABR9T7W3_9SPHI|nr:hypothetical protein [Sphingobacterium pedocola]
MHEPLSWHPAGTVPNLLLLPQPPDEQLPHPIFLFYIYIEPLPGTFNFPLSIIFKGRGEI